MSGLPREWAAVEIGAICDLINGRAFKPTDWSTSGVPIVRIQNLNNPDAPFNYCDFEVDPRVEIHSGGMKIAMQTLDLARPSIGALAVGLAQRCLDECVKHLNERFPEKTYPGQTLQFKLADMQIQIEGAREAQHHTMALREAACRSPGNPPSPRRSAPTSR
jgi:alkylation response protein AidB-like acyl-CoA dehydrogenase